MNMKKHLFFFYFFLVPIILSGQNNNNEITDFKERAIRILDNEGLDQLDIKYQSVGWEWINEEQPEKNELFYPEAITFLSYKSHPNYRVIDNGVYDDKGELVRVINLTRNRNLNEICKTLVFAQDYLNNKYGINKAPAKTQYALKNRLGLSDEVAQCAGKHLNTAIEANMEKAFSVSRTRKNQAKIKENRAGAALLGEIFKLEDEQANRFIRQLEADHEKDFSQIIEIKRIDNKTFRLFFVNDSGVSTYAYNIVFDNDGKYKEKISNAYLVKFDSFNIDETKDIIPDSLYKNKDDNATDRDASFPGGNNALVKWVSENLRYPLFAAENGIQGRVIVKFTVLTTGEISDVIVVRGVDEMLDREAIRLVKSMPKWIPGKRNGELVNIRYTFPITFSI